jgi:hypothetical protein
MDFGFVPVVPPKSTRLQTFEGLALGTVATTGS